METEIKELQAKIEDFSGEACKPLLVWVIDMLARRAKEYQEEEEEFVDAENRFGGNIDDAYSGGMRDGIDYYAYTLINQLTRLSKYV
jgi:hypothetical protein